MCRDLISRYSWFYHKLSFGSFPESFFCVRDVVAAATGAVMPFVCIIADDDFNTSIFECSKWYNICPLCSFKNCSFNKVKWIYTCVEHYKHYMYTKMGMFLLKAHVNHFPQCKMIRFLFSINNWVNIFSSFALQSHKNCTENYGNLSWTMPL